MRAKRKRLLRVKKFIIVVSSKKSNSQTKRLFSFIIACFLRNTSTILSFRETKRLKRFNLRDFHYTHQDFIVARQKDLELDFDYKFSFFKLFSSIISSQFFREFILDFSNDTDLFNLETRELSSILFVQSFQSLLTSLCSSSSYHVRKRH